MSIFYVHGTWGQLVLPFIGRRPFWFEKESAFRSDLETRLARKGIVITATQYLWTGANSLHDRNWAAFALAERISKDTERHPGRAHLIIAHSHGGNIALRAASILETRRTNQSWLDSKLSVVTIATPFVHLSAKRLLPVWIIFLVPAAFCILAPLLFVGNAVFQWMASTEAPKAMLRVVLFGAFLVLLKALSGRDMDPRKSDADRRVSKADALIQASRFEPLPAALPLLIMHAARDEAALALRLGQIGNKISLIASSALAVIAWIIPIASAFGLKPPGEMDWWLIFFFVSAALFASLLFAGLFKATHGRELVLGSLILDVSATIIPGELGLGRLVRMSSRTRGMVHSLYNHPKAAAVIATWLNLETRHPKP